MAKQQDRMEQLVSLCKRRGFIFQSSEIYGGLNGCWDYGPLGVELKRNVKDAWWAEMVTGRDDVVGLDASILMNPRVWEASGHVGGFSDPMRTCKHCKKHVRSDQIDDLYEKSEWVASLGNICTEGSVVGTVTFNGQDLMRWARKKGAKLAPGLAVVRNPQVTLSWLAERVERDGPNISLQDLFSYLATEQFRMTGLITPCPHCGGELTEPRDFNLMFETHLGAMRDTASKAYLRPETAQGIFVDYLNVLASSRIKIPFGIGQIGKAFRNEINPRNFTFRSREFEQMEIEFFCKPGTERQWWEHWRQLRYDWYINLGLSTERLHMREHGEKELAHYANFCTDIEYDFPFGTSELEGIASRTDYDLKKHAEHSGKDMQYFEDETREKFVPYVVEPSAGVDRSVLAFLCEAFQTDEVGGKPRTVLRFHPRLAPIKVAVFPLVKKEGMPEKARAIYDDCRRQFASFYDEKSAVGRRYRRQDEAGTPFCVTIDGDTATDNTVTIRDRDTLVQERISADKVVAYLHDKLKI